MTGEIRNPAKLPADLYPAEKKFARCLAEGQSCIVGNGKLPGPEERIESGGNANVVRGEVIRFFAYGGNEENPVLGPIIDLQGARISGVLNLAHARILYALHFSNCHFDDSVRIPHAECVALYLHGSHLAKGLSADGLTTKGSVNLRRGFSAEGEVRLLGAKIGGNLDCEGGKFHNPDKEALAADGLTTKGNVNFRNGFSAEGRVRLLGAKIGGSLDCEGGKFHNPGGNALVADRLMTKDNVHFQNGFSAEGEVRLLGARIGGNLDCGGGKFHNADRNALFGDKVTVRGDVNFLDGFSVEGEMRLVNANIGGDFNCEDGKFYNPNKYALNADKGKIGGTLFWWKITCEGDVNLAYAKADILADDPDSWKSCKVVLDGFTYNRFASHKDIQSRIDWLAKRPIWKKFSPMPYEQAAKVLLGMGHSVEAWGILREKRRLEQKHNKDSWWQRAWGGMIDAMTDFVYRPLRTVGWTAGIVLAGAVFFGVADRCAWIVPHQPIVLAKKEYQNAREDGSHPFDAAREAVPDYPGFNPLMFSLDVFVPLFNLHQESYWAPNSGKGDFFRWLTRGKGEFEGWWLLTAWYWIEIMAGWLLSSLLLLSVTGLLRPRIGGGD